MKSLSCQVHAQRMQIEVKSQHRHLPHIPPRIASRHPFMPSGSLIKSIAFVSCRR
jgi:hypothetical protein